MRFVGAQVAPLLAAIDFQASFPGGPGRPAGYALSTPGGSIVLDESGAVQTVATVQNGYWVRVNSGNNTSGENICNRWWVDACSMQND